MTIKTQRQDYRIIYEIIENEAKVLDLGCGDGELLSFLAKEKNAKVQGIELDSEAIRSCVEKGLTVFHSDIESGLSFYPDKAFDYVILNQSLQQLKRVEFVIHESLRVGRKIIVGFPNFAQIGARLALLFRGKAPVTSDLPYLWYSTPNLRFLSIQDFRDYCQAKGISIFKAYHFCHGLQVCFLPNLIASGAIYVIGNGGGVKSV